MFIHQNLVCMSEPSHFSLELIFKSQLVDISQIGYEQKNTLGDKAS